jgi:superfamily II DNA or RNA helicase
MLHLYDQRTKAEFMEAARSSRHRGETWVVALKAAMAAGYRGSLDDLCKLVQQEAQKIRQSANLHSIAPDFSELKISLAKAVRAQFDSNVLARGEGYYRDGAVRIQSGDHSSVEADVKGSKRYSVALDLADNELVVYCDCPYFADAGPCKHIWAAILAADALGHVQPTNDRSIRVTEAVLADEDDDDFEDEEYDSDKFEDEEDFGASPRPSNIVKLSEFRPPQPRTPSWKQLVTDLWQNLRQKQEIDRKRMPVNTEIVYVVDLPVTLTGNGLALEVFSRQRKLDGNFGRLKSHTIGRSLAATLPDPIDRQITAMLLGGNNNVSYGGYYYGYESGTSRFLLTEELQDALLPIMCRSGRCRLRGKAEDEGTPLQLDEGPPWEFRLEISRDEKSQEYVLQGSLHRSDERKDLAEPAMLVAGGWVFWPDRVARLNDSKAFQWISLLRRQKEIRAPIAHGMELLAMLFRFAELPPLNLPEELSYEETAVAPRPRLMVRKHKLEHIRNKVCGELSFDYGGMIVGGEEPGCGVFNPKERKLSRRDLAIEQRAAERLMQLGFRPEPYYNADSHVLELAPSKLPRAVTALLAENWHVEAEGKLYRRAGNFNISVTSGIDWFELHGDVDFGGAAAALPELLAALRKGENIVKLDDGSFGMLPEEWLKKFGLLAGTGAVHEDHLRFTKTQAFFLDALLAAQPEATCDETFSRVREELRGFQAVAPADPPETFKGQLRGYQREGLGWLNFLRRFGFGGCLADDMGLGKTVQVLALLESRRKLRGKEGDNKDRVGPTLAVVPRSLIFNWKQEAMRFTPQLRVLDHTGATRVKGAADHFEDYDLILTTYGTLRRDIAHLKDIRFDYVILDEAQAVKNAGTASAKAARLLQGNQRLCMSGTPVENHLGELWSLFEFLNPGMLGAAAVFKLGTSGERAPDEQTRTLLARALRPFILRRTKSQVAKDLPEKTEQTLYCELGHDQRNLYDELRDHYRQALLNRVQRDGINKSKIQILEALLRLRQAACHPGLIAKHRIPEPSAKLEALLPQLTEVLEEGHKALVFSQFTSLLSIVRLRLEADGITHEYLDGQTRDREARVNRFQNDPACKLFLISLKAGGLGLNLTAAEYIFLLDPWWNPAVEAQAIDRAHRIGQARQVFAYRLIARDTVEEKVLELQQTKRNLAEAIINADNSLIRSLSRDDLELLLG